MSVRSAIAIVRMAVLFILAGGPFVPLLAELYPGRVIPIILAGAFVLAAPLGIVLARALQRMLEDELAANYRKWERFYFLAAAASQAGVVTARLGRGTIVTLGVAASAAGMAGAIWLLLKVSPAGNPRHPCFPNPVDQEPVK